MTQTVFADAWYFIALTIVLTAIMRGHYASVSAMERPVSSHTRSC
jgi:hypothetical protein